MNNNKVYMTCDINKIG